MMMTFSSSGKVAPVFGLEEEEALEEEAAAYGGGLSDGKSCR